MFSMSARKVSIPPTCRNFGASVRSRNSSRILSGGAPSAATARRVTMWPAVLRWPGNFVHFLWLVLVVTACGVMYGVLRLAIFAFVWGPRRARTLGALRGVVLRWAMTALGATFIKLGQVMSTRPDLFGPEVIAQLR